ncbi:TIGR02757 family protein [Saccharicrinis carchari]|uniref:TIGR02757 family protein n=1 Tax=Saccharicrinis carchari TaxID=1168039 RepID=A0A521DBR7_SACCC|nr:TIGR02757 family protein [Saccharicrinis carchari]SMO69167.1 TIGR02757 family protein [Saccharicrinis carchari]
MEPKELKSFLDEKVMAYNAPAFIASDPISLPKLFSEKEDIEIAGFLAATISWGQRQAIIKAGHRILSLMGQQPHYFVVNGDVSAIPDGPVYRTFNGADLRYFILALRNIYANYGGLEQVFTDGYMPNKSLKESIAHFRKVFISFRPPERTGKHVANVLKNSSAKRICMFLRWMVRADRMQVDFGLWKRIDAAHLMLPLDVHTGNVARKLGLLSRKQSDWKAVEEITARLREFEPADPIKYDYALFGLGVFEKF